MNQKARRHHQWITSKAASILPYKIQVKREMVQVRKRNALEDHQTLRPEIWNWMNTRFGPMTYGIKWSYLIEEDMASFLFAEQSDTVLFKLAWAG